MLGGNRLQKDFAALGLKGEAQSKHHAKVVAARKIAKDFRADIAEEWQRAAALQTVPATGLVSCPGLFAWDRLDRGSALLLEQLPKDLRGHGADLGCGHGALASAMLQGQDTGIKSLQCLDADARAVEACRVNLQPFAAVATCRWSDVTRDAVATRPLDWIVMNPPFHEGKLTDASVGAAFIAAAAKSLRRAGSLWMVANSHLPYESVLEKNFGQYEKLAERDGYKIYCARKIAR